MNSDIPLNVIINSYHIFVMSRFYSTFFSNKDLTLNIATSVKNYKLQYISQNDYIKSLLVGEASVVMPRPSSTIYTYENMRDFIPLYKMYVKLAKRNNDKVNKIKSFINFSRYNLSKSDKFICDCCSYYSGVNYFMLDCFTYIITHIQSKKDYKKLCKLTKSITYIFDGNMKKMLSMPHSCLIIKEDVIMKETLDDVNKYVNVLKKIDKHFEPVLEQNKLYDYLFHLVYYTVLFERIEDRWCPYKYLTKNINQIINDDSDVGRFDPSYKSVLVAVNENIMKNGSISSIKCKDCSIVKDKKNQDLLAYNVKEVDGVFTDMKSILVDLYRSQSPR